MADFRALILQRHRQLKWKAFDWLEAALMVLCGVCITMFTLAVFLDVVTRTPRCAVALAAAGDDRLLRLGRVRRHGGGDAAQRPLLPDRDHQAHDRRAAHRDRDHEPADRARRRRAAGLVRHAERAARSRQLPHALADPADRLHGDRAGRRRADLPVHARAAGLRLAERLRRPRGPRRFARGRADERQRRPAPDDGAVPGVRLHGRAGLVRAHRRRARRDRVHADQHAVDGRPAVPRHRLGDAAGGAVLPAGRRADGVVRRRARG